MNYQMPVKAIKNILGKELEEFYNTATQILHNSCTSESDVPKNMIWIATDKLREQLKLCNSYEELGQYISDAGYRMSLEEWINSL